MSNDQGPPLCPYRVAAACGLVLCAILFVAAALGAVVYWGGRTFL